MVEAAARHNCNIACSCSRKVAAAAVAEKPAGRFMIRSRTRVVKRHPEGDW
jgi:hypothetical protein